MGSVDLADHLRGTYRIDNGVRNRKWWWSILFWSVGVMLTNAYIMYIKINVSDGAEKKNLLSHHDFRKAIAFSWINQKEYTAEFAASISPTLSRKRKAPGASSVASSLTMDSPMTTSSSKRLARVLDQSIHPTGALSIRLDTKYDHLPQRTTTSKARCALHRWAGVEMWSSIFFVRLVMLTCAWIATNISIRTWILFGQKRRFWIN